MIKSKVSHKLDSYPFCGWDWTEICDALNLPWIHPDCGFPDQVMVLEYYLSVVIHRHTWGYNERVLPYTANVIRQYTVKLAEVNITYWKPFWEGLSNVKDDETFLIIFCRVCGGAWT